MCQSCGNHQCSTTGFHFQIKRFLPNADLQSFVAYSQAFQSVNITSAPSATLICIKYLVLKPIFHNYIKYMPVRIARFIRGWNFESARQINRRCWDARYSGWLKRTQACHRIDAVSSFPNWHCFQHNGYWETTWTTNRTNLWDFQIWS